MAGMDPGLAVPVWLAEDDLGCIICQGLLTRPATLPCGHSFCRDCLKDLWAAGSASTPRSCPTCRESTPAPLRLRKNTLLQELVDKYSQARRELGAGPDAGPAPGPAQGRALGPARAPAPPRRAAQLPVGRCNALPPRPPAPRACARPTVCPPDPACLLSRRAAVTLCTPALGRVALSMKKLGWGEPQFPDIPPAWLLLGTFPLLSSLTAVSLNVLIPG